MSGKGLQVASEAQEQGALVQWLRVHPFLKNYFCKNNNEGKRTPAQTWNLKLQGLRPGVSDLFIYWPTKTHHGLFLEVKRAMRYPPSVRRSATWQPQEEFMSTVRGVGFEARFCYGFLDGKEIIEQYLLSWRQTSFLSVVNALLARLVGSASQAGVLHSCGCPDYKNSVKAILTQ